MFLYHFKQQFKLTIVDYGFSKLTHHFILFIDHTSTSALPETHTRNPGLKLTSSGEDYLETVVWKDV